MEEKALFRFSPIFHTTDRRGCVIIRHMGRPRSLFASILLVLLCSASAFPQSRTVAITVDDLPFAGLTAGLPSGHTAETAATMVNRKLWAAFKTHNVPVTGFVIETVVESLGSTGTELLKQWTTQGFDLGNHTYSHRDGNELREEQIEEDIVRGEKTFVPLMKAAGRNPEYFRFPMNHTGDTKEKHDAIAAFLSQRGFKLATCTIDNEDYVFNNAYVRMLAHGDKEAARKTQAEYLAYTSSEIDYYAGLHKQVLGYEPPHVMLLHANWLNADVIDQVLALFEKKGYRFVSLRTAQSDPAYQTPETFVTKFGLMWGYRWAAERGVKVNGSLETEPSKWIVEYDK
jgi:peptidoglycan/xylan/chitin deacetylase (PgdA/CDA1 family)